MAAHPSGTINYSSGSGATDCSRISEDPGSIGKMCSKPTRRMVWRNRSTDHYIFQPIHYNCEGDTVVTLSMGFIEPLHDNSSGVSDNFLHSIPSHCFRSFFSWYWYRRCLWLFHQIDEIVERYVSMMKLSHLCYPPSSLSLTWNT